MLLMPAAAFARRPRPQSPANAMTSSTIGTPSSAHKQNVTTTIFAHWRRGWMSIAVSRSRTSSFSSGVSRDTARRRPRSVEARKLGRGVRPDARPVREIAPIGSSTSSSLLSLLSAIASPPSNPLSTSPFPRADGAGEGERNLPSFDCRPPDDTDALRDGASRSRPTSSVSWPTSPRSTAASCGAPCAVATSACAAQQHSRSRASERAVSSGQRAHRRLP